LRLHEFTTESAAGRALVRIQDGQGKGEHKKYRGQPCGEFHQHVGCLRAENIVSNPTTKRRTQAFALWPLHQDDKNHQHGNQRKKYEAKVNQQVHREAKYLQRNETSKRPTLNIDLRKVQR
jgi:hypothetical protein